MNEYEKEVEYLKRLLADACIEVARWKVAHDSLKIKYDKLKEEKSGVVRLPFFKNNNIPRG